MFTWETASIAFSDSALVVTSSIDSVLSSSFITCILCSPGGSYMRHGTTHHLSLPQFRRIVDDSDFKPQVHHGGAGQLAAKLFEQGAFAKLGQLLQQDGVGYHDFQNPSLQARDPGQRS